ncbi:MAG: hypothetical protein K0R39_5131 [Symbiobacteriaceae bacterium]|jgi:hypothetical protein|nr:hypothetical protein [Symbiobacteriaceae bacterium]
MQADQVLIRSSTRWFLVVLVLGIWLRTAFVWIYNPAPFAWGSLIHAHSHTAYFGWAGLGLMGLVLYVLPSLTGRPLAAPRPMKWLLALSPWAVGGALVTFALWGYAAPSIAFSAVNEVVWFCFAYVFWQNVRGRAVRDWPAALWLIGVGVVMLLVSTLSTVLILLTRVVFETSSPVLYNSGVYLFLQAYGDGWMEVAMMGVVGAFVGGLPCRGLARLQALLMLTLMVPASLRLLMPYGLAGSLTAVGVTAGIGLSLAQVLYLVQVAPLVRRMPAVVKPWWLLAGGALAVKAVLEWLPLAPGWMEMALERNLVIAFLHLKLLALVTAAMIGALAYVGDLGRGFRLFAVGTVTMVGALAAHGSFVATTPALSRPLYVVAFVAGVIAAVGAAGAVWPVAFGAEDPAVVRRPPGAPVHR